MLMNILHRLMILKLIETVDSLDSFFIFTRINYFLWKKAKHLEEYAQHHKAEKYLNESVS